jgi:hypothetical protein
VRHHFQSASPLTPFKAGLRTSLALLIAAIQKEVATEALEAQGHLNSKIKR